CVMRWCSSCAARKGKCWCRARWSSCHATTCRRRPTPSAPTASGRSSRANCAARWRPRSCVGSTPRRVAWRVEATQALKPDRLAAQLGSGPLAQAWLVAGTEPLLVLEAADAIRAAARAQGIIEREVHDADGRDYDW